MSVKANVQDGAKLLGTYNPSRLVTIFRTARAFGESALRLKQLQDGTGIMLNGAQSDFILMGMRMNEAQAKSKAELKRDAERAAAEAESGPADEAAPEYSMAGEGRESHARMTVEEVLEQVDHIAGRWQNT